MSDNLYQTGTHNKENARFLVAFAKKWQNRKKTIGFVYRLIYKDSQSYFLLFI